MDILKNGSMVLSSIRKKFLSQDIQYRVLATGDIYTLTAAIGKQLFRTETDMGLTIREWASDFIIEAEDLPGVVPERGDEILFDGRVFEVLAPNGEPVWRWTDGYRTAMRIHTKEAGPYVPPAPPVPPVTEPDTEEEDPAGDVEDGE